MIISSNKSLYLQNKNYIPFKGDSIGCDIFLSSDTYLKNTLKNKREYVKSVLDMRNENGENICHKMDINKAKILFEELDNNFYTLLSCKDNDGNTPFYTKINDIEIANFLFNNPNIDKNAILKILQIKNNEGQTPLHIMTFSSTLKLFDFLNDDKKMQAELLLQTDNLNRRVIDPSIGFYTSDVKLKKNFLVTKIDKLAKNISLSPTYRKNIETLYADEISSSNALLSSKHKKNGLDEVLPQQSKIYCRNSVSSDISAKKSLEKLASFAEIGENGLSNVYNTPLQVVFFNAENAIKSKYEEEANEILKKILTAKDDTGSYWCYHTAHVKRAAKILKASPDFWYELLSHEAPCISPAICSLDIGTLKMIEPLFDDAPELFVKLLNMPDSDDYSLINRPKNQNSEKATLAYAMYIRALDKMNKSEKSIDKSDLWVHPKFTKDVDVEEIHKNLLESPKPYRRNTLVDRLLSKYLRAGDLDLYKELLLGFKFNDGSRLINMATSKKFATKILLPVKDDFDLVAAQLLTKNDKGFSYFDKNHRETFEILMDFYADDFQKVCDFYEIAKTDMPDTSKYIISDNKVKLPLYEGKNANSKEIDDIVNKYFPKNKNGISKIFDSDILVLFTACGELKKIEGGQEKIKEILINYKDINSKTLLEHFGLAVLPFYIKTFENDPELLTKFLSIENKNGAKYLWSLRPNVLTRVYKALSSREDLIKKLFIDYSSNGRNYEYYLRLSNERVVLKRIIADIDKKLQESAN